MSNRIGLTALVAVVLIAGAGTAHAQDEEFGRRGVSVSIGAAASSVGTSCIPTCAVDRQNGVSWTFRVAGHVASPFALGLETTVYSAGVTTAKGAGDWRMGWATLTGVWYPNSEADFFVKVGAGLTIATVDVPFTIAGNVRLKTSDIGYVAGIGRDFYLTDRIAITAYADFLATSRSRATFGGADSGARISTDILHAGLAISIP
ncbi:MAG: hypothetical protein FJ202_07690 [Gemmatimonadetes bacterium]|nr:hypothetical protein [Gemmatimonadota bacterium]